jgi:ribosomal protein S18 acetylase RimI-like enzyme
MEKKDDLLAGLLIRPLAMEDLDAIVEIDREVVGKARQEYWKSKIEPPNTRYPEFRLVAEMDGKVIGVILGEVSGWEFGIPDTIGWISAIGVDPAYQHRGVAARLIQEFVRNLKSLGVNVLYTMVNWKDWDLLKFYRAAGFTRGGEMINLELKID